MSRSEVIRRLRALATRGVPMSVRYLLPAHAEVVAQALAVFGGFDRARAASGLPAPVTERDANVIIGALRSLARSGVRLDIPTLSAMGESSLLEACDDTFGGFAAALGRAGLAPPPEARRPERSVRHAGPDRGGPDRGGYDRGDRGDRGGYDRGGYDRGDRGGYDRGDHDRGHDRGAPGFAQPPLSPDGQVTTAAALESLHKTAVALGRVPAARDLPPDVARRLTSDYGSVRFAYLALRIHAESESESAERGAGSAVEAAILPVADISAEALAAVARLPGAAVSVRAPQDTSYAAGVPIATYAASLEPAPPLQLDDVALRAVWAGVEAVIEDAAAAASARLQAGLGDALGAFVGEVTGQARSATLAALVLDGAWGASSGGGADG